MERKILLTGDRPSGKLHLGHYVGSLQNRISMQHQYESYIEIADVQSLAQADNMRDPSLIQRSIFEVASDYLSVGIDPDVATIFLQSAIPEIPELTGYFMNFVTLARLERNPTVKTELRQKGLDQSVPVGFLCYPISQAADIVSFGAEVVPVGEDQLPVLEQCNELVRGFNRVYNVSFLKECQPVVGRIGRLPGIDGKNKASKSLNNAIYLSDERAELKEKVNAMYTDPDHVRASDPGKVEGNIVFTYLDAFYQDRDELDELKTRYRKGGLGDMALKGLLFDCLDQLLSPMRERRSALTQEMVWDVLKTGSRKAREKASTTLHQIRDIMRINYWE